jgi:hypothetical protein
MGGGAASSGGRGSLPERCVAVEGDGLPFYRLEARGDAAGRWLAQGARRSSVMARVRAAWHGAGLLVRLRQGTAAWTRRARRDGLAGGCAGRGGAGARGGTAVLASGAGVGACTAAAMVLR